MSDPTPPQSSRHPRALRIWALTVLGSVLLLAGALASLAALGGVYRPMPIVSAESLDGDSASPESLDRQRSAERRLTRLRPRGAHLVVDTYTGRLRLYRDEQVVLDTICSAGSGGVLRDPRTGRIWIFKTPLGERRVERKVEDPVWVKPDWAFIEEGFAPPPIDHPDRVDRFSLGDFGLYLGDGYIIHGTIFQSVLGQRVTHGCVRLGDEDLRFVYQNIPLGGRVYLY